MPNTAAKTKNPPRTTFNADFIRKLYQKCAAEILIKLKQNDFFEINNFRPELKPYQGVPLRSARAGLFVVALPLHSYASLQNGFAATTIPNAFF